MSNRKCSGYLLRNIITCRDDLPSGRTVDQFGYEDRSRAKSGSTAETAEHTAREVICN